MFFCQVLEYEVMKGRIHEDDIVDVAARWNEEDVRVSECSFMGI